MKNKQLKSHNEGIYTPDTHVKYEELFCDICGDKMEVERKRMGATSLVEAMSGCVHEYDHFKCPNLKEKWHIQVIAIRRKMKETPSKAIEDIMAREVEDILKTRKSTKEAFNSWVT